MNELWHALARQAEQQPAAIALSDESGSLRYGELWLRIQAQAQHLTAQLAAHGASGRPVALAADNGMAWVVQDLACLLAQIPCVPVPPFFNETQRRHLLRDSGCALLCVGTPEGWQLQWLDLPAVTLPAGTCKITYTSGSTGSPKGVCLSQSQLMRTLVALAERLGALEVQQHLCTMPLAVLLENLAGVYLPLWLGRRVHLPSLGSLGLDSLQHPDPQRFIATLAASQADSLILLPATLGWLVAACEQGALPAERWRLLAVGGGKSGRLLLQRADAVGLPVYEGYGLSEVGSVVALNGPSARRLGSVGRPLSHLQVRLAADGEVLVRGNSMLGYLGDPNAPDPEGWLATGDWGQWDADGFLTILGRKKSTLVTGFGRNVAPEWLEAELAAVPGVLQSFVYGDEGQGVQALLFAPMLAADPHGEARLRACNQNLPEYARLNGWQFIKTPFSREAGELTANGRLRRDTIRQLRLGADALAGSRPLFKELS